MDNIEILYKEIKSGKLVFPLNEEINQISISNVIKSFIEKTSIKDDVRLSELSRMYSKNNHAVLFLADGFGMNFFEMLPHRSFIKENFFMKGTSVFPSSTGPNLLSLSTGTWPGSHGDLGWETYLNQISDSSTLIKWERSKDKKKLSDLGLNLEEVYLEKSLLSDYKINFSFMVPHEYKDVPLLNWISNGKILPYKNIFDSLSFCIDRIKSSQERTLTFIYWPDIDFFAHKTGAFSEETKNNELKLEDIFLIFKKYLPKNVSLLLTSDHGHLDVSNKRIKLQEYNEIQQMLLAPISGEQRFAFLHLGENRDKFYQIFKDQFGDKFFIFDSKNISSDGLFGPNVKKEVLLRMGDTTIISQSDYSLDFSKNHNDLSGLLSDHGGLSHEEMDIPIIFYDT